VLVTLEAALETSWTRANLAVYADYLQAQHDPRGELIAIDLHLARNGGSLEIQTRRTALLAQLGVSAFGSDFRYGFADALGLASNVLPMSRSALDVFRATPMGPYLRALVLCGTKGWLRSQFAALVRGTHRWLRRIAIRVDGAASGAVLSKRSGEALAKAAPHLEIIEVAGAAARAVLGDFHHPNVPIVMGTENVTRLRVEVPGMLRESIELGRMARLHGGILDELSEPGREAWAELRFFIEELRSNVEPQPFPAAVLATALAELDPAMYYVSDWLPIRDKLPGLDSVNLALVS
jgi:hypothetical protein